MTTKRRDPDPIADLLKSVRAEPKRPANLRDPKSFWTLIGTGSMGLKAEKLFDTSEAQQNSGFTLNPRIVLRMNWFDDFKKRNGIFDAVKRGASEDEIKARVMAGVFSEKELAILVMIQKQYEGTPLAVRSSAHGDSRGTGVYHSGFCINVKSSKKNLEDLIFQIKKVIASEFSPGAIAFRKDLGLEDGMAVIIEPVFGRHYTNHMGENSDLRLFGPSISGFGYTSTAFGSGYVRIVFGMPEYAIRGGGIQIEMNDPRVIGSLEEYIDNSSNIVRHAAATMDAAVFDLDSYELGGSHYCQDPSSEQFNLAVLFSSIREFEHLTGGEPKYIEFAGRLQGSVLSKPTQEIALLQVADMHPQKDFAVFPETIENVVFEGYDPIGEEIRKCKGINIVEVDDPGMSWYNQSHKNYVLVVPSAFLKEDYNEYFNYSSFNNAAIVIVVADNTKSRNKPLSEHFKGLCDTTHKLFMVIDDQLAPEMLVRFVAEKMGMELPADKLLQEMDLEFEALVSRKQGKGFVRLLANGQD